MECLALEVDTSLGSRRVEHP